MSCIQLINQKDFLMCNNTDKVMKDFGECSSVLFFPPQLKAMLQKFDKSENISHKSEIITYKSEIITRKSEILLTIQR